MASNDNESLSRKGTFSSKLEQLGSRALRPLSTRQKQEPDVDFFLAEDDQKRPIRKTIFTAVRNIVTKRSKTTSKRVQSLVKYLGETYFADSKDKRESQDLMMEMCFMIMDIGGCIPPDHPWQGIVLDALNILRQRNTEIPHIIDCSWKDPYGLPLAISDATNDCISHGSLIFKNTNSFVARLCKAGFDGFDRKGFYVISAALEETLTDQYPPSQHSDEDLGLNPDPEAWIWGATEWLLHRTASMFLVLTRWSGCPPGEADHRAFKVGTLGEDLGLHRYSVERWRFWKKQLQDSVEKYNLDEEMDARIQEAVKAMGAVEENLMDEYLEVRSVVIYDSDLYADDDDDDDDDDDEPDLLMEEA